MSGPAIRLYVVNHDVGFAPNPYSGICTLACCRPDIRRNAKLGDYILGFGSSTVGLERRLVYFMKVEELLEVDDYSTDARFAGKVPCYNGPTYKEYGDRVYRRERRSEPWTQLPSFHSHRDGSPNPNSIARDTSAPVLVSKEYCYWGRDAILVPSHLAWLPVERRKGKRLITDPRQVQAVVDWLTAIPKRHLCGGDPAHWGAKQLSKRRLTGAPHGVAGPTAVSL